MISLKHISTLSVFNQTKFSADSTDSSYFLGSDQTQIFQGTPDVKYNDLCYIKCSNLQYTHGHLYGSTEVGEAHVSLTQEEYDALSEEEKNNGKIYLIKESTIPGLIDQLPLATTTTNGLMSAEDKEKLTSSRTYALLSNGTDYIYYWKSGNLVSLDLFISDFTTAKEWILPEGFRPRKMIFPPVSSGAGGSICGNIAITENGKISIGVSLTGVRCFVTFVI